MEPWGIPQGIPWLRLCISVMFFAARLAIGWVGVCLKTSRGRDSESRASLAESRDTPRDATSAAMHGSRTNQLPQKRIASMLEDFGNQKTFKTFVFHRNPYSQIADSVSASKIGLEPSLGGIQGVSRGCPRGYPGGYPG